VLAAPLLDQHGAAIRSAISQDRRWPAKLAAAPSRAVGQS
jgi:hypothetical protein